MHVLSLFTSGHVKELRKKKLEYEPFFRHGELLNWFNLFWSALSSAARDCTSMKTTAPVVHSNEVIIESFSEENNQ